MDFITFSDTLKSSLEGISLNLTETQQKRLFSLYEATQKWGRRMNFTRNLEFDDYLRENLLDPLVALATYRDAVSDWPKRWFDLGTGGGYVGLTAAILFEEALEITLIDSVRRKVSFIQSFIRESSIKNCNTIHLRAEGLKIEEPALIVSRATWAWPELLQRSRQLLAKGGQVLSFEGPEAVQQNPDGVDLALSYDIPGFARTRHLFVNHVQV